MISADEKFAEALFYERHIRRLIGSNELRHNGVLINSLI